MRARLIGTTPLAPMPVATRHHTNAVPLDASVVAAVSTTNRVSDPRITGRRPTRSDSGPHTNVITP